MPLPPLPIDVVLPELQRALATGTAAVLVASPGAGKTTRVPLALLDASWRGDGRILMLEPRRLAARAAARHMARLLDENVGETVGYRVRMDAKVSSRTRIEVLLSSLLAVRADLLLDLAREPQLEEVHQGMVKVGCGKCVHVALNTLLSLINPAL